MTLSPGRFLSKRIHSLGLEPGEGRLLLLMGALVAVLMFAYTIAKVLRDAMFLSEFGALRLPYAYVGVAFAAAATVWIESGLVRRFPRAGAARLHQFAAIVFSVLAAASLPHARHLIAAIFYLWTGSQAMMLLPHFWVLALEVWDSRRARRLFPLLAACGLVGGMAAGGFSAWSARLVGHSGLMWILSGLFLAAHGLTLAVGRFGAHRQAPPEPISSASRWQIVRSSSYIKTLIAGLALSVIVGTLVDFQFKYLVQQTYPGPQAVTRFLGAFYGGLNAVSLVLEVGAAGWLMRRFGLAASTGLQPGTVMIFAVCSAMTVGWWGIVALRWIQGVASITLGKSSTEIYFSAIHPHDRRRIKPAIDTLVERWSDAAVGVLLIVALHLLRVPVGVIAVGTAIVAAAWLAVLFVLDRQYSRAFHEALSRRWIDPETASALMRVPSARRAIAKTLASGTEDQIKTALAMSREIHDPVLGRAVAGCLRHPSAAVRAAAIEAMGSAGLSDHGGVAEALIREPHEEVRRAAVGYLLRFGGSPLEFARGILEGNDGALRDYLLDAMIDGPAEARAALRAEWIDARLSSGDREDQILAARALRAAPVHATPPRLLKLLESRDAEVRRAALMAAARRPGPGIRGALAGLLLDPETDQEASEALAAAGDVAIPALEPLLGAGRDHRAQAIAARTLARIGSPRAIVTLTTLVRDVDPSRRQVGLRALTRVRVRLRHPVLPRAVAHRLFLRELRDYRSRLHPALTLEKSDAREVALLGESFRESAEWALERGLQALACWYDPRPLPGVLHRLKSGDPAATAPALEYLGQILPRRMFRTVTRIFEEPPWRDPDDTDHPSEDDRLARWIRAAWESGDSWLRACAVRASPRAPSIRPDLFAGGDGGDAMVLAEIERLRVGGAAC